MGKLCGYGMGTGWVLDGYCMGTVWVLYGYCMGTVWVLCGYCVNQQLGTAMFGPHFGPQPPHSKYKHRQPEIEDDQIDTRQ